MKLFLRILCTLFISVGFIPSFGQTCTSASLNWDALSFLDPKTYSGLNSTGTTYANQSFAFGKNKITVTNTYANANIIGENSKSVCEAGSYGTGDDVQFTGDGTVTFTFQTAVQNVKFSIYDIDVSQKMVITAANGAAAQNVTIANVSGSVLTLAGSGTTSASAVASTAVVDETTAGGTDGTINVDIAGPVTTVKLTVSLSGTKNGSVKEDGSFWISDITACSPSPSFPLNYQKTGANQPFTNQPDYFLTTPDNNSAYMVDPVTGKAQWLFTETASTYINSFAYDPYKHILYYVLDATNTPGTNKKIKKYDFNTETISDFIPDVTAIGIPTFTGGVESAGASFYDGALYLGIEGGSTGETMTWRIDIDATTGNVTGTAYQVYGVSATGHDWGDFILKDGMLYDFNTSTSTGQFKHLNLQTGNLVSFSSTNVGQAAMSWAGDLYSVRNVVEKYNLDGTKGTATPTITVVKGPSWVGNAGDASENFRPKADFGDAPNTYDPDPLAPAVHELDANLKLGAAEDVEWTKKTASASANTDTDDGLTYVRILNLSSGKYQTDVTVYNNTGSIATVGAWIDFNNDGIFQLGEGVTQNVGTNTASQNISLYWTGIASNLPNNSYTYLRIRVTSATNNMTAANPTGYFANGEVEDYYVPVNVTPLAVQKLQFDAVKEKSQVKVKWTVSNETDVVRFVAMRSADAINWQPIAESTAKGTYEYATYDYKPLQGKSYYRLKTIYGDGRFSYSEVKEVSFELSKFIVNINTNPAVNNLNLSIYTPEAGAAIITLVDMNGLGSINLSSSLQKGYNNIIVPVSQLHAGNYILQINQGTFSDRKKVMILK